MIFEKLANGITKHAKLVIVAWIVLLLAMAYPMSHASDSFNYDSTDVGGTNSESMDGMKILSEHYVSIATTSLSQSLIIPFDATKYDPSTVMGPFCMKMNEKLANYGKCDIAHGGSAMGAPMQSPVKPGEWICMFSITYNTDISAEDMINDTGNLRDYISKSMDEICTDMSLERSDFTTYVTGTGAMSYDTMQSTSRDLSIVDPIAIFMIIVLVGLFFRSFVASAAAPSVIGIALAIVLGLIYFVGQVLSISSSVEIILVVSMLGAGCDYCIFILSRYREERRSGKEHIEACRQAIMWAGESVATSGLAVMCGFGAMSICSFGMVSNMGIVLAMGILVAIFAALTLMSSVLTLVGDKLFWPTGAASPKLEKGYLRAFGNLAVKYFTSSTRFSIKHAEAIVVATILFTVPMVYVYATAENSYDMIGSMMNGESNDGMTIMQDFLGGGNVMPNYVVFETKESLGTVTNIKIDDETTYGTLDWTPTSGTITDVMTHLNGYATDLQDIDYIMKVECPNTAANWAALLAACSVPSDATLEQALVKIATELPESAPTISKIGGLLNEEGVMPAIMSQVPGFDPTHANNEGVTKLMDWFMFIGTGTLGITHVDDSTSKV
ncbi:MAG: MMPL family transporter, partial [archaeon]|nr:MMPL family transporter [archaeon]